MHILILQPFSQFIGEFRLSPMFVEHLTHDVLAGDFEFLFVLLKSQICLFYL